MKKHLKKNFYLTLLLILVCFTNIQVVNAQSSVYDSLRSYLSAMDNHFQQSRFNVSGLLEASIKAQAVCKTNTRLNDKIAYKLLAVEDTLLMLIRENGVMNFSNENHRMIDSCAIPYFKKLAAILQNLPPQKKHPAYAASLYNLGSLYISEDRHLAGIYFKEALAIRKEMQDTHHPDYAKSLLAAALYYNSETGFDTALVLMQDAIAILKENPGEESFDYADALLELAQLYQHQKKIELYNEAEKLYRQAFEIKKKLMDESNKDYPLLLANMAMRYGYILQYDQAMLLYEQALMLTEKSMGEENLLYITCLNDIGNIYYTQGAYAKAIPYFSRALLIKRKLSDEKQTGLDFSLYQLATIYQKMGLHEEAIPMLIEAREIWKKNTSEAGKVNDYIVNKLALSYEFMGEYENALPLYQQTRDSAKKFAGHENLFYARTLDYMAGLYDKIGQQENALAYAKESLAIRQRITGKNHPEYFSGLNRLANLYIRSGQFDSALSMLRQGLTIIKTLFNEDHADYAAGLSNLAEVYKNMGLYDSAINYAALAAAIRKRSLGETHPDYAAALNNLGDLYALTGKLKEAAELYAEALAIRKNTLGIVHPEYANSLYSMGLLLMKQGKYTEAADFLIASGNIQMAHAERTFTTLSEDEKIILINKFSALFSCLPSLLVLQGNAKPGIVQQVFSNEMALKGMVLNNQRQVFQSIRNNSDSNMLKLYEQWRINKTLLGNQFILSQDKRIMNVDSLAETVTELEQKLSRSSAAFNNHGQFSGNIKPPDVAQKLKNGEAAVEFIRFRFYDKQFTDSFMYAAMILLPGDTVPVFVQLCEEKKLYALLKPSENNNEYAIKKLYPQQVATETKSGNSSDVLYQMIWQPLERYFNGVHTIYYAPAGLLNRVAFSALKAGTNVLLIDKYQMNQVLSTRTVAINSEPALPVQISTWGNIEYNRRGNVPQRKAYSSAEKRSSVIPSSFNFYTSDTRDERGGVWEPLPGTKQETDSIQHLFLKAGKMVISVSDTAATEEVFKMLDGKSPQVLHMATHGFFLSPEIILSKQNNSNNSVINAFAAQPRPMFRSGLVLAGGNYTWVYAQTVYGMEDGILTAYEIAQMDLSNTDLVVLSACETALGDLKGNEGVIGLQRAFKMAGVKQIIMSLWKVPDKQTMELMTIFYSNWLSGMPVRIALHNAQLKMKEKYEPYNWAAFVLVE